MIKNYISVLVINSVWNSVDSHLWSTVRTVAPQPWGGIRINVFHVVGAITSAVGESVNMYVADAMAN